MTSLLFRLDKIENQITRFDNGNEAVSKFMSDFRIKTRNTAKSNLFDLLTDPAMYFWQNTEVAWAKSAEDFHSSPPRHPRYGNGNRYDGG